MEERGSPQCLPSEAIPSVALRLLRRTYDHEARRLFNDAVPLPPAKVSLQNDRTGLGIYCAWEDTVGIRCASPYSVLSTALETPPTDQENVTQWPAVTAPRFQGWQAGKRRDRNSPVTWNIDQLLCETPWGKWPGPIVATSVKSGCEAVAYTCADLSRENALATTRFREKNRLIQNFFSPTLS